MSVASVSVREISIPSGDKRRKKSTKLANALALELLQYGIAPEQAVLDRIASHKKEKARELCRSILDMYTLGDLNRPLFFNWESRTEFTFTECVFQIFGYMLQISGNDLYDPAYMAVLKTKVTFDDTKKLKLASEGRALKRFKALVNSKVALDKKSQTDLVKLAGEYHEHAPKYIRSAEARIAVIIGMVKAGFSLWVALESVSREAADVLRYAAAVNDFEYVKLPADVKYANLSWQHRRALLERLNRFAFDDLCEAMGNNRGAWVRFFRHMHLFNQREYQNKYTNVIAAAYVSIGSRLDAIPKGAVRSRVLGMSKLYDVTPTGNLAYRTFASRVQTAVDNKDLNALETEVIRKPTYLFRNLGALSNACTKRTASRFVELVRGLIDKPSTAVLLSLLQIDVNAKYRIIDAKGITTVQPADYNPVITEIQGLAEREIYRRHGFEGQVQVADALKDRVVPFLSTNAELDRGTRIKFEDARYLYFLMHWVQRAGRRTDLDHSYVCYDSNWNSETVYFGRQANDFIAQSGDITNAPAPNGGTEYGRINLSKVPNNIRYIVPIINVYSGDAFSDNDTAYAGFMFSDNSEFRLQREHTRYDLSQPAQSNVPFVIDMENREIIIVDFNERERLGWTAHSSIGQIRQLIEALKTKKFMTIGRFADMLSGDSDKVSLSITAKGKGKTKVSPENLVKLVS